MTRQAGSLERNVTMAWACRPYLKRAIPGLLGLTTTRK